MRKSLALVVAVAVLAGGGYAYYRHRQTPPAPIINAARVTLGDLAEAVEVAGRTRLRPILMTSLATMLGLVPMALGIGEGSELQVPLARVVIGGLLTSTFITLVFVPTVYTLFEEGWAGLWKKHPPQQAAH